jgi:hypothetical protein
MPDKLKIAVPSFELEVDSVPLALACRRAPFAPLPPVTAA